MPKKTKTTTKTTPPTEGEILRAKIEELTGKPPRSWNTRTLRRALASIEAKAASGESVRKRDADATTFGVSMPAAARVAVISLIKKSGQKTSAWTREALAAYAESTGHPREAAVIRGDS